MQQKHLFEVVPSHRLAQLSKEQLIEFFEAQQDVIEPFQRKIKQLEAEASKLKQTILFIDDKYIVLKNKFFGKSSEKEPVQNDDGEKPDSSSKKTRIQLPSLRYPNAPLIETEIEFKDLPNCDCCGTQMSDSGMTEDAEFLTVVPKQYFVVRQKRHKYRCGHCHGDIKTAPAPKRITPSSSTSDEMVIDVALAKYCDLVPIQRYSAIAGRQGLKDLPPQSLIESTHHLAHFVSGAYHKLKEEVLNSKVLHADETPHRMLEGDDKTHWYLWGFSNSIASIFDIRDTRSGDVASQLLANSNCTHLVSDVFSGYAKAVRDANEVRKEKNLPLIYNVYCNAHARRKFKEAKDSFTNEAQYFVDQYKEIYRLEGEAREKPPDDIPKYLLQSRSQMSPFFKAMKLRALANIKAYSSKSRIAKAMSYFLKNYEELTLFVKDTELPIDNNPQERLLRNPVIGRKTWYGTHSKRGAETAAVLFSLVESCKLNKVSPRDYFQKLIQDLHNGLKPYTPNQYKNS